MFRWFQPSRSTGENMGSRISFRSRNIRLARNNPITFISGYRSDNMDFIALKCAPVVITSSTIAIVVGGVYAGVS